MYVKIDLIVNHQKCIDNWIMLHCEIERGAKYSVPCPFHSQNAALSVKSTVLK